MKLQRFSFSLHPKSYRTIFMMLKSKRKLLRDEFENAGWKCAELLSKIDTTPDFYFDVVSQIQMKHWSKGRVTLVGDACDCPSLLSGQGSTLAMVGAYILAGELREANGNYKTAYEQYEKIFKPFIDRKQKIAQIFAKSLVPKSKFGIWYAKYFYQSYVFTVRFKAVYKAIYGR